MDDSTEITLALAGELYSGPFSSWKAYARALMKGRVHAYRTSSAFGNQTLTAFFAFALRTWNPATPLPLPTAFGLVPLRPCSLDQSQAINELIAA